MLLCWRAAESLLDHAGLYSPILLHGYVMEINLAIQDDLGCYARLSKSEHYVTNLFASCELQCEERAEVLVTQAKLGIQILA